MSLVTAQGRQAQADFEAQADLPRAPLLAFIKAAAPVSVSALLAQFPNERERTIREAMWRLLDAKVVSINAARQLEIGPR